MCLRVPTIKLIILKIALIHDGMGRHYRPFAIDHGLPMIANPSSLRGPAIRIVTTGYVRTITWKPIVILMMLHMPDAPESLGARTDHGVLGIGG
jgi:hypothetical protein